MLWRVNDAESNGMNDNKMEELRENLFQSWNAYYRYKVDFPGLEIRFTYVAPAGNASRIS